VQNKINFQKKLEETIKNLEQREEIPRLLLHSCCAPCSSYVLEYLSNYFSITLFYYNPNISEEEEYQRRVLEQKTLIEKLPVKHPISFLEGRHEPKVFFDKTKGLWDLPEGGKRCFQCYELRLRESAKVAKEKGFDFFTTTLSISPMKNAQKLNELGKMLEEEYDIAYLYSDFKKKNGYLRSTQLSKEYHLYRQDYCGCIFSKREAKERKEKQNINR